jgi:hypothetical protein
MTRIERLEHDLAQLRELKQQSLRRNDFVNLSKCTEKIDELEKRLVEAKNYEPHKLYDELVDKGEDVKNAIYKAMLKCTLAADFANDCAFSVRSELNKIGINDFSFRKDLAELVRLSQKIASLVIIPNQQCLTETVVDDDEFIEACHAAADKQLKEKLKL